MAAGVSDKSLRLVMIQAAAIESMRRSRAFTVPLAWNSAETPAQRFFPSDAAALSYIKLTFDALRTYIYLPGLCLTQGMQSEGLLPQRRGAACQQAYQCVNSSKQPFFFFFF